MRPPLGRGLVVVPLALALAGGACREDSLGPSLPDRVIEQVFPQDRRNDVDLLFVVDNSAGMAEEQAALVRAFPRLLEALRAAPSGMPGLRVGIVSSDLGAPGSRLAECARGDRGALQAVPRSPTCRPPAGRYLVSLDGGARTNFAGDLAEAFACLAPLGTDGCGFEQHLASARRALGAEQPLENDGFLRPHALLALVVIADEDDCSAPPDTDLFEPATERYGPQRSFRCAEFGHLCGGRPPPRSATAAPLGICRPAEAQGKLVPVAEFVSFFRGLKPEPERVLVAVLAGPPAPYAVQAQAAGPELAPSCAAPGGGATPAVRLQAFADAFGPRGLFANVCDGDLGPPLARLGQAIGQQVGAACLRAAPVRFWRHASDGGVEAAWADCRVSERIAPFGPETPLPRCDGGPLRPCWRLQRSPERCAGAGWELKIERVRAAPPDAVAIARCRACVDPRDTRCR